MSFSRLRNYDSPLDRLRESLRRTLRQILLFIVFGAALAALLMEWLNFSNDVPGTIFFLLFVGSIIGIPLWILFRILRFALAR